MILYSEYTYNRDMLKRIFALILDFCTTIRTTTVVVNVHNIRTHVLTDWLQAVITRIASLPVELEICF